MRHEKVVGMAPLTFVDQPECCKCTAVGEEAFLFCDVFLSKQSEGL